MYEPKWNTDEMTYFDSNHEDIMIRDMSAGMNLVEICEFFGVSVDEVAESAEDDKFLRYHFRRGRGEAKKKAVGALFEQMRTKGGGQIAISYLARFADDWTAEIEADSETGRKSFTVILD